MVLVPSVNQHRRGQKLEQMVEEEIEPLIDFVSVEEKKREAVHPKDTSVTPPLNQRLYCTYTGKLFSCAHTASTRRTSLDIEDMRRQRHKPTQRPHFFFHFTPTQAGQLLTHTLTSNKIIHTSSCCFVRRKQRRQTQSCSLHQ